MAEQTEDCCNGEVRTDPKAYRPKQRNENKTLPQKLKDPILPELRDRGKDEDFWTKYGEDFVPYSGSTLNLSHIYLSFLNRLCRVSDTKGAINGALKRYGFNKIDIIFKTDPVFDLGENLSEVNPSLKKRFREFIKENTTWYGVDEIECSQKRFAEYCSDEFNANGNIFVEIVHAETLGARHTSIYIHKTEHCLYLKTRKREQRWVGISPVWEDSYIQRYRPDLIPLYPLAILDDNGAERSMIHIKNGNATWYGRPMTEASVRSQFDEAKLGEHFSKECGNRFLGQLIVEDEEDNPEHYTEDEYSKEDGYESVAAQVQANFSADAENLSSVWYKTRGFGSGRMVVEQITSETSESFYKDSFEFLQGKILKTAGWTKNFLTGDVPSGFSQQQFLDEYEMKILPTVLENTNTCGNELQNLILNEVMRFQENTEFEDLGIMFKDLYFDTRKQLKEANENIDNSVGSDKEESSIG